MFVTARHLHPSLIYMDINRTGLHSKVELLGMPNNTRLGLKWIKLTNALAYYTVACFSVNGLMIFKSMSTSASNFIVLTTTKLIRVQSYKTLLTVNYKLEY